MTLQFPIKLTCNIYPNTENFPFSCKTKHAAKRWALNTKKLIITANSIKKKLQPRSNEQVSARVSRYSLSRIHLSTLHNPNRPEIPKSHGHKNAESELPNSVIARSSKPNTPLLSPRQTRRQRIAAAV